MYCDFNPKLFKEFISIKKKIKPELADDWEIIPYSYNTNSGMMLYSEKLNQKIADIDLRRFLQFSKDQNLTIQGLKLQGTYVVGNDRSVYTKDMFNKWKDKFDTRTEIIINKKDYKVGHKYLTPCGAKVIYLGYRYVASIKDDYDYKKITKITKKYYVCEPQTEKSKFTHKHTRRIFELKQKFTEDLGKVMYDNEDIDLYLESFKSRNINIACFEKEKPKNVEFGLVELSDFDKESSKKYYHAENYYRCLVVKIDNKYYGGYLNVKNNKNDKNDKIGKIGKIGKINKKSLIHFDIKTLSLGKPLLSLYERGELVDVDKSYRIGLIDSNSKL